MYSTNMVAPFTFFLSYIPAIFFTFCGPIIPRFWDYLDDTQLHCELAKYCRLDFPIPNFVITPL